MTSAYFLSATPMLASLDIERSITFFCDHFGFHSQFVQQDVYGIVTSGPVSIHFWACTEKHIAENTSCRIQVKGIEALFTSCQLADIVHPNAQLELKPWGLREFGALDPDGNLITFFESAA